VEEKRTFQMVFQDHTSHSTSTSVKNWMDVDGIMRNFNLTEEQFVKYKFIVMEMHSILAKDWTWVFL